MTRSRAARRLAAITTALLLGGGVAVAASTPASAQTVDPAAWYQLISVHSGKAIDVEGASASAGARVLQYAPHDRHNQQFRFVPADSGYYRIAARHSGMVLDVYEWNPANGAEIRQWHDLNGYNQQWQIVDAGGGAVSFINRFSGKALDVWEWSTADGARISQYDRTGGTNQQWRLVRVGGDNNPPPPPPGQGDCGAGSFHAEVTQSGASWTARNGGATVYNGSDFRAAVQAALNSLTPGRTSKQRVVVRGSGTISAGSRISVPSYTALAVCGTINVTGSGSGDQAPVYARGARDIEVEHLTLTGSPLYGVFMRNVENVVLGQIDMRLSSGLGIRIDNRRRPQRPQPQHPDRQRLRAGHELPRGGDLRRRRPDDRHGHRPQHRLLRPDPQRHHQRHRGPGGRPGRRHRDRIRRVPDGEP